MFNNRRATGRPFWRVYSQYSAALRLENIYKDGVDLGLPDADIVTNLTIEIERQVAQNVFISRHLIRSALDVSFRGITDIERVTFFSIANAVADKVLIERDHFHLEF